ncbi:Kinase/pyrophosphorylase-domain-containing protein [Baffinella frigidus]|nr:Kinase/pyrophosphorylase-domain-containing protein [Cryptophyta sp. CCMP2293]
MGKREPSTAHRREWVGVQDESVRAWKSGRWHDYNYREGRIQEEEAQHESSPADGTLPMAGVSMAQRSMLFFLAICQCLCANLPTTSSTAVRHHVEASLCLRGGGGIFGRKVAGRYGGMVVPQAKPAATPPAKQEEIVMAKPAAPVVDEEDRAAAVGGVLQHDNAHSGAQSWKERRDAAVPVAMPARSNSDLGKARPDPPSDRTCTPAAVYDSCSALMALGEEAIVYDSCSALMALGEEEIDPYTSTRIKWLYIVSDSTGFTASHALTLVLAQFNQRVSYESTDVGFTASHALTSVLAQFNQRVSVDDNSNQRVFVDDTEEGGEEGGEAKFEVRTHMFSNVLEPVRLDRIVQLASKMQACIIYTLVNPALNARIIERCETLHVEFEDLLGPLTTHLSEYLHASPTEDLIGPLTTHLSEYLHASPTGQPRGAPGEKRKPLSSKYFSRIEAVEFTIKHDDGTLPVNLPKADDSVAGRADVVLLGVSRSSKTPLAIYLAQHTTVVLLGVSRSSKTPPAIYLAQQFGFKVANVPVLLDKPLPAQLLQVDPRRVFCLLVDEKYLRRVRAQRLANSDLDFNLEIK